MRNITQGSFEEGALDPADMDGVKGVFRDIDSLNRAVDRLAQESVPLDQIHVFVTDGEGRRPREVSVDDEAGTLQGALAGAGVGAVTGLAIVVLVPTGAFGPVDVDVFGIASTFGAVRAIAILAAAGVPLGALLGMGHWKLRKKVSKREIEKGSAWVVVETEELAEQVRAILHEAGAQPVIQSR